MKMVLKTAYPISQCWTGDEFQSKNVGSSSYASLDFFDGDSICLAWTVDNVKCWAFDVWDVFSDDMYEDDH